MFRASFPPLLRGVSKPGLGVPLVLLAVLGLVSLVAMPSCSKTASFNSDPEAYRPDDPDWLLHLDLPELYEKTDWDALRTHGTMESLLTDAPGLNAVMDILFGPGVDRSRPALVFQQRNGPVRGFAGVADPEALAAGFAEAGMEDPEKSGGVRYLRAAGGWVCWTDAIVAYYSGEADGETLAEKAFALPGENATDADADAGAEASADLAAFLEMPGMLHAWMQAERFHSGMPMLDGFTDDFGAVRVGLRMTSETGLAGLHFAVAGLTSEHAEQMQSWFLRASKRKPWEQIPAGTPAWLAVDAMPELEQAEPGGRTFMGDLGGLTGGLTAAFHQIKITRRGFIPRVSVWADAPATDGAAAMETQMRDIGILESGNRLQLGTMDAEYAVGPNRIVASTTEPPATLLVMPRDPVVLPDGFAEALRSSPLRLYVDAQALSKVLPLPEAATTLRDLTLYLEPRPAGMEVHLQVRTFDPEASGADVALKATMELIPAIQTMAAFQ